MNFKLHILNIPNFASFRGPLDSIAVRRASPRTNRVLEGMIMPSSQRRADEKMASLSLSIRDLSAGSTDFPTVSITALSCSAPITPDHISRTMEQYEAQGMLMHRC